MGIGAGFRVLRSAGWLAAGSALVLAGCLPATVMGARTADSGACTVVNERTGDTDATLASAVKVARPGDTLTVSGTCAGGVDLTRDVTIVAAQDAEVIVEAPGRGSTIVVGGDATVTLRGLVIEGGKGEPCLSVLRCGGSINSSGTLTLEDVTLTGGRSKLGGGLFVRMGRTTLAGATRITDGTAYAGAGAYVEDGAMLILVGSASIDGNRAAHAGGGVQVRGELYLSETAAIRDNTVRTLSGGGVFVENGRLGMVGTSTIAGNEAPRGGGIDAQTGLVQLGEGSAVVGNRSDSRGGGVFLDTVIELRGTARIEANIAGSEGGGIYGGGAGIVNLGESSMITGNQAVTGGGIYLRGIATLGGDATIVGNTADAGAGVWFDLGTLDAPYCGISIRDNVVQDCNIDE